MSIDLILIIVGAVLILLAISGSISMGSADRSLIDLKFRLPIGIIGLFLIIYSGYSYGTINSMDQAQMETASRGNQLKVKYPIEFVQVISPVAGDSIECRVLTMGVYPDGHTKDIWVLLRPSDDKYYPQSDYTNTSYKRNGEWQVLTRFGGDKGEKYDIIVYEADATASTFFSSTIEDWKKELTYPGLQKSEIPDGAVEINRISVYLQENCRGVF